MALMVILFLELSIIVFNNIDGDGIDFSGSRVKVSGCHFVKIADKAVSVGESSDVDLAFLKVRDVSFGIVSKDSSRLKVTSSDIKNASIAGISAYELERNIWAS